MRIPRALRRTSTAAVVVALSLAVPASARAAGVPHPVAGVVDVSTIGIDNFGRIDSTYYRGAQPKGGDYPALKALGVRTVINLTSDDADPTEKAMAEGAGLQYVQIPMTTHERPSTEQLARFLSVVNDPANQPVYVHCVGGRHRTGVMTAAYRMASEGWTADQAFREMKQYNFGADFLHPEFKQFVYDYHPDTLRAAATQATAAGSAATATATPRHR